ncbi:multidrug ABC transporter ATPase/permease [Streptococcus suis]|nr:multidrug ABC transporter ATPase/permease [Streptococcus suis]
MDKKEMPTSVLIPRLLQSMKHLLSRIAVAVCFAVLGQVVTIAIPVTLVYLAFDALSGNPAPLWTLGVLILLALLRGAFRYGGALLWSLCGLSYAGGLSSFDFRKIAGLGSWEIGSAGQR